MTLTIDGHPHPPLKPRVAAMVLLLIEHEQEIEQLSCGCVELHYSSFNVEYIPPRAPVRRKVGKGAEPPSR